MTIRCWVTGCQIKHIACHKLPTKEFEKKKWIRSMCNKKLKNIPFNEIPTTVGVCRDHFLPKDYNGRRLKNGVYPTQNLPCVQISESDSDISLEEDCNSTFNKMDIDFAEHNISLKYTKNSVVKSTLSDSQRPLRNLSPNIFIKEPFQFSTSTTSSFENNHVTKVLTDSSIREKSQCEFTINNAGDSAKTKSCKKIKRNANRLDLLMAKFKCPMCKMTESKSKLILHYKNVHKLNLNTVKMKFSTEIEFKDWKKITENKSGSRFIKKYIPNSKYQTSKCEVYACHCNGFFKLGKTKNKPNYVGLKRINGYCPAKMIVYTQSDNNLTVLYTATHLGHRTGNRAVRSKEDKILEFDAIQAEAISSMCANHGDDSDKLPTSIKQKKTKTKSPLNNSPIFKKRRMKNGLHKIIRYINELTSDASIQLIDQTLAPIISSVRNWLKKLCTSKESLPLVNKQLSTLVKQMDIQVNPVRLYRLSGNPFKGYKNLKKTEQVTSYNAELSTVNIIQLPEPVGESSSDPCTEIINTINTQHLIPIVTEIKSQYTEPTNVITQSNDTHESSGNHQIKSNLLETNSPRLLKPKIRIYSKANRINKKIGTLSHKITKVNEELLPHVPSMSVISECNEGTETIQLDEFISANPETLNIVSPSDSQIDLVTQESNISYSVSTNDVELPIITLYTELPVIPVSHFTHPLPTVSFLPVEETTSSLNHQCLTLQNNSVAEKNDGRGLENSCLLLNSDGIND